MQFTEILLEYVCPLAGIVTGTIMFSAPYRDTAKATQNGDLGSLNPTPWIFMAGNTYGWILYGMLINNLFIFFANSPGFLISIWLNMQAIKIQYENIRSHSLRQSIVTALEEKSADLKSSAFLESEENKNTSDSNKHHSGIDTKEPNSTIDFAKVVWDASVNNVSAPPAAHEIMVLAMATVWIALSAIVAYGLSFSSSTKELIIGIAVNLNLVFFYGAPLSTIQTVIRTRSSATIHIPTMITNTCNGCFWGAYGFAVQDFFVAVPNSLGALLGVLQIFLSIIFPRRQDTTETSMATINSKDQKSVTDNYVQSVESDSSEDKVGNSKSKASIPRGDSSSE